MTHVARFLTNMLLLAHFLTYMLLLALWMTFVAHLLTHVPCSYVLSILLALCVSLFFASSDSIARQLIIQLQATAKSSDDGQVEGTICPSGDYKNALEAQTMASAAVKKEQEKADQSQAAAPTMAGATVVEEEDVIDVPKVETSASDMNEAKGEDEPADVDAEGDDAEGDVNEDRDGKKKSKKKGGGKK